MTNINVLSNMHISRAMKSGSVMFVHSHNKDNSKSIAINKPTSLIVCQLCTNRYGLPTD